MVGCKGFYRRISAHSPVGGGGGEQRRSVAGGGTTSATRTRVCFQACSWLTNPPKLLHCPWSPTRTPSTPVPPQPFPQFGCWDGRGQAPNQPPPPSCPTCVLPEEGDLPLRPPSVFWPNQTLSLASVWCLSAGFSLTSCVVATSGFLCARRCVTSLGCDGGVFVSGFGPFGSHKHVVGAAVGVGGDGPGLL